MARVEGETAAGAGRALTAEHAVLLGQVYLFRGLDRVTLARLVGCAEAVPVATGELVCRQGDPADGLYVVARGVFAVSAAPPGGPEVRLGTTRAGEFFGEMALLTHEPRSATVRADGPGEVLRLDQHRFGELLQRDPEVARALAVSLCLRLRERERGWHGGSPAWGASANGAGSAGALATGAAPAGGVPGSVERPATASAQGGPVRSERHKAGPWIVAGLAGLLFAIAAGAAASGAEARWVFLPLLAAATVLWTSALLPDGVVGLAFVGAWLPLGLAEPAQLAAGFATVEWLSVVAIFGIAAATARSGLLFRIGLVLLRRMRDGLFWQAGTLMLAGVLLSPLLPLNVGRAALTAPLALAVAEAQRLRDREPAAAVLGLATYIGAGPLMFVFLNSSPITLLAWGLLPEASRTRFDWLHWLAGAAPLGLLVAAGSLLSLFLVLRPQRARPVSRERVLVQLAVLGPPSRREQAMLAVLAATVVGWIVAPPLGLHVGTVAAAGLFASVLTGYLDKKSLQELDWSYIVFYGVALSTARVIDSLDLDLAVAELAIAQLGALHVDPLVFVLAVGTVSVAARLVVSQEQAIFLLALAVVPAAQALHLEPWIGIIVLVATSVNWLLPVQTPSYLVAYATSEGRLFSHAQARRVAIAFIGVTLASLALTVPYWRLLGFLSP